MSGGILSVATAIRSIGAAATLAATEVEKAADAINRVTSSGMAANGAASTGGMGAANGTPQDGPAVTTGGLKIAIQTLQGRT